MSKTTTLVKNTAIIALGKLSTQFVGFLLLPLYTAYLSVAEFGVVDLITITAALIAPIVMLSLEMAVFRFLIDGRGDKKTQIAIITNSSQMIAFVALAASLLYIVAIQFIAIPYAWLVLGVTSAIIIANYCLQVARGLGDNIRFSIGSVVAGVSTVTLNVLFIVFMKMGATGMLLATMIGNLLCAAYLIYSLKIYTYFDISIAGKTTKKKLLSYSLPLIPNSVSWWVVNAADRMIIAFFLGITSNGIYAVAYKFPQIFSAFYSFFGMSWTESASVHINSKDRDIFFSKVANLSLRIFGSLGAIIIVGVAVLFPLLINEKYHDARMYIPILIIGALFNSIVGTYSAIYVAQKRTKQVLYTSLAAAGTSITLSLILTPLIGLYGPAVALIAAYFSMAILRHRDISKTITVTYDNSAIYSVVVLYGVTIALYYINSILANIISVIFVSAAVVYINRHTLRLAKSVLISKATRVRNKKNRKYS